MDGNPEKLANRSEAKERPLIDAAWAQFEALAARHKPSLTDGRPSFTVPGYRVLREIHRGGQGVVYQAMQDSTNRKVAIKVLREGPLADEAELARFDREVDVLSRLKHPHIVAIHDRGSTAGHAYYVMDYIAGRPLDAYVAGAALSTRQILDLFQKICEAVNVAHLRGVIHRDLKPSNVRIDEEGEPHVLDFGLAKLTRDESSAAQTMTITGQFVGSLPWASPEQAQGRSELLDIRTDVYSLGVILYQLLTGSFPYPVSGRMDDVVRNIIQTSPARPSSLVRGIDRDVEVILLKCLAKDPERRFQGAGELARDIQRHRNGEPIEARPATSLYQLRQFARRNRALLTGVTVLAVALVLGTIGSTMGFMRATRAEKLALKKSQESAIAAGKAAAVSNFLQEMLSSVDPSKALGKDVTIKQVLDDAAVKVGSGSLKDQPGVEAELRSTIGTTYAAIGHYAQAEEHLRAALALRRQKPGVGAALAQELANLGDVVGTQGDHVEEEKCMREALRLFQEAYAGDHRQVAGAEQGLAASLRAQGKLSEAEPHYRAALEMRKRLFGDEHADVAQSLNSLALLAQNKGDLGTSERLFRDALAIRAKVFGDPHPIVADALNNLANLLRIQEKFDEAEALLRKALEMRQKLLGSEHPGVAQSLNNLANVLRDQRKAAEATPMYREALAIWRKTLPSNHPNIAIVLGGLSTVLIVQKEYPEAETHMRECLSILESDSPRKELNILKAKSLLGEALAGQLKFDEAEALLLATLEGFKEHPHEFLKNETIRRLGILYEAWGRPDDAVRWRGQLKDVKEQRV